MRGLLRMKEARRCLCGVVKKIMGGYSRGRAAIASQKIGEVSLFGGAMNVSIFFFFIRFSKRDKQEISTKVHFTILEIPRPV